MALQPSFGASTMNMDSDGSTAHKQKWNIPENSNGCFDCNICLDSSQEPVVTLCGHLYCWPCIYKWLQVQSSSFESNEQPKCPVCKAYISTSSLVPLYGGGRSLSESESETKKPQLDLIVPPRPPALALNALLASPDPNPRNNPNSLQLNNQAFNQQQYFSHPINHYTSTLGSTTSASSFSPTINMVGEIVFAGMFGSSDTNVFAYPHSNSYHFMRNGSPRLRRQEIQLDKSLNRLSMFLFCCIVLCLILF